MKAILKSLFIFWVLSVNALAVDSVLPHDKVKIGKRGNTSKIVEADINAGSANPKLKFDVSDSKWKFANDGSTFSEIGSTGASTTYLWSGYHSSNCSWSTSSSSYVDPSVDTTCTFTELLNKNFGTVTSYNDGTPGNNYPGITFTAPAIGYYYVCAGTYFQNGNTNTANLELSDTTTTFVIDQALVTSTTNILLEADLCGIYYASAAASRTIRIRMGTAGSTATMQVGNLDTYAISWKIYYIGN